MNKKNEHTKLNFPENKKVREKLKRGDPAIIAKSAGISVTYVRDMLNGRRRFTDKVSSAIIKLLHNRENLRKCLENLASTGTNQESTNQ